LNVENDSNGSRYLIHAPYGGKEARLGAWKALTEAQREGKIRSLGVSNYGVHHLEELANYIKQTDMKEGEGKGGVISVGQWEVHPWCSRFDIVEWCRQHGVVVEVSIFSRLTRQKLISLGVLPSRSYATI
jgi:diketogulonate reductase-like aldo/keto reductase